MLKRKYFFIESLRWFDCCGYCWILLVFFRRRVFEKNEGEYINYKFIILGIFYC